MSGTRITERAHVKGGRGCWLSESETRCVLLGLHQIDARTLQGARPHGTLAVLAVVQEARAARLGTERRVQVGVALVAERRLLIELLLRRLLVEWRRWLIVARRLAHAGWVVNGASQRMVYLTGHALVERLRRRVQLERLLRRQEVRLRQGVRRGEDGRRAGRSVALDRAVRVQVGRLARHDRAARLAQHRSRVLELLDRATSYVTLGKSRFKFI